MRGEMGLPSHGVRFAHCSPLTWLQKTRNEFEVFCTFFIDDGSFLIGLPPPPPSL